LEAFRQRILGQSTGALDFGDFVREGEAVTGAGAGVTLSETKLLLRIEEILGLLSQLSAEDLFLVRSVLGTIISGQELDLKRFAGATAEQIVMLETAAELDDYTYRVAGCVGEFWTRMCRAHLFRADSIDESLLIERGIRFGKGLQLINILRDLPADLRAGRCYLPAQRLQELGLNAADLLQQENYNRLRPLYCDLLGQAEAHLEAGWFYTNMLPRRCVRIRLACAWPILIGVRTSGKLRNGNVLSSEKPIKITRSEVRQIIRRSLFGQLWPPLWRRLFVTCKVV